MLWPLPKVTAPRGTMNLDLVLSDAEDECDEPCKGLFFRCKESYFRRPSNGAYVYSIEFVPLKRMSCSGCDQCDYLHEFVVESGGQFDFENPENDAIYQLQVTDYMRDWETGCVEDWAVGLVRVNPTQ